MVKMKIVWYQAFVSLKDCGVNPTSFLKYLTK